MEFTKKPDAILVVDDTPDRLEVMSVLLSQAGYQVFTARGGREALNIVSRENLDLVISDVTMPEMSGVELCRTIRADANLRDIPLMLVSALRKDSASVVEGLQAGADDYLESPFDPLRLAAKVARLIERKRSEEELRQAYQALQRTHSHLNGIIEGTPDSIAALDLEFRFIAFNKSYSQDFE